MRSIQPRSIAKAVTVVTDEPRSDLRGLIAALAGREVAVQVVDAADVRPSLRGVVYVRRIDPGLDDPHRYARAAYLSAFPERTVNAPGAVHIAEWAPLAARALDEAGIPQPRRIWCFDAGEARRAASLLGFPVAVERVREPQRTTAADEPDLEEAVERLCDPTRGVLLERPIDAEDVHRVLVVDGQAVSRHGDVAERLAVAAVEAVGGSAMGVEVHVDARGRAYVQRILPAPELQAFGPAAVAAVVDALGSRQRAVRHAAHAAPRVPVPA